MKPPVRRGGYFKARANVWQEAHIAARWTAENPAPQWWAELDAAWQADQGLSPSIRDFADFLGWGKGRADRLLSAVAADLATWTRDKNGTKTGQQRDSSGTETGQPDEVERQEVSAEQDSGGTAAGQSRDISRARSSYPDYRPQPSDPDLSMNMSPPAAPAVETPAAAAAPPPAAVPKPQPTPKPAAADEAEALAVWMAWKETHRGCKATPPPDVAKGIRAALKAHGAETVIAVVRWSQTSDHSRARFLQGERNGRMVPGEAYGLATIMRHVGEYDGLRVAQEEAPAASPRMSALPPGMKPRGVVIDADSGKVQVEEGPRNQPTGSKKLDLMVSAAERLQRLREQEEEEERQQQEVQSAEV